MNVLRVTDERDGELRPRMYSYWANSVVKDGNVILVFVGHVDGRPRFFMVNRTTGEVGRLGPLLKYTGEGEGWYWNLEGQLYLIEGPRLRRVGPLRPEQDEVVFDITDTHPGCDLWQAHSSDDGRVHSATVRQIVEGGRYPYLGTVVSIDGKQRWEPSQGNLDESHITGNGRWLLVEDSNDLWIYDLVEGGKPRVIRDEEGALAHLDTGANFAVGEDNFAGACVYLNLETGERRTLFNTWGMGHVAVRGDRCLLSDAQSISLVALDGSGVTRLIEHRMVGDDYDHQVKTNLSPCGEVACYMSNNGDGGGRQDVFLLIE